MNQKEKWGDRKKLMLAAGGILLLGVVSLLSLYLREFVKCHHDVTIYAQAARNLADGKGLTTNLRYVFEVPMTPLVDGQLSWQYLRNLGQPFFLWAPIKLSGGSETSILIFSSLVFFLTLIPFYLITKKLSDPLTGVVACVLCLLDQWILRVGYQGFTQVPFLFFMTWCFYFFIRDERHDARSLCVSALLLGAASYFREDARYIAIAMIAYLVIILRGRTRLWKPILLYGIFFAATLPRSLYFLHYFGTTTTPYVSFLLLNFLEPYPSWIATSYLDLPSVKEIIVSYPLDLFERGLHFLWRSLWLIPKLHTTTMFLTLLGLPVVMRSKTQRNYAFLFIGILALFLAQHTLAIPQERYYMMPAFYFLPVAAIGIVTLVRESAARGKAQKQMIAVIIAAVALWHAHRIAEPFYNTEMHEKNQSERADFLAVYEKLNQTIPKNAWVLSDKIVDVAWYVNRRVINLPVDMETLERLQNDYAVPRDSYFVLREWYKDRAGLFDKAYFESYSKHVPLAGREFMGALRRGNQPEALVFAPIRPADKADL